MQVYVRNTGTTATWYSLPYTTGGLTINFTDFRVGFVDVQANVATPNLDFRIVVISGTALTKLNAVNPHLNFNNFSEVASALHLSN